MNAFPVERCEQSFNKKLKGAFMAFSVSICKMFVDTLQLHKKIRQKLM